MITWFYCTCPKVETSPLLPRWRPKISCANPLSSGSKENGWIWPVKQGSTCNWKRPLNEPPRYCTARHPNPLTHTHTSTHHPTCSYTNSYISLVGRSTLLRCTSSRPKTTMLGITGVRSPTRTSLTAVPLTWKLKVCQSNKVHCVNLHKYGKHRTKCSLAYVSLLSCRGWAGTEYWYSIGFQKKVIKKNVIQAQEMMIFWRNQQQPSWIQYSKLFIFFLLTWTTQTDYMMITDKWSILLHNYFSTRHNFVHVTFQ